MPIECVLLDMKREHYAICPRCHADFKGFMRGEVQSNWRRLLRLRYCAVICTKCKQIVGWEKP